VSLEKLNMISNNSLYKFFYLAKLKNIGFNNKRIKTFIKEFSGTDDVKYDIFDSFRILFNLKTDNNLISSKIKAIQE